MNLELNLSVVLDAKIIHVLPPLQYKLYCESLFVHCKDNKATSK